MGEVAVAPKHLADWNVSREIAVIPFNSHILPKYGMFAIAAPQSQEYMMTKVRGTAYQGINLKDVRRLEIPVPPVDVQNKIIAKLDFLYSLVDAILLKKLNCQREIDSLFNSIKSSIFQEGVN